MALDPNIVFRDFETDGVPSSGIHEPVKAEIRELLTNYEVFIDQGGNSTIFSTRATLYANLAYAANTLAWVVQDTTTAYNGIYQKIDVSGAGSWLRVADLPYSFVKMSDVGAGTANAIQVTSSIPTSTSVLRVSNIFEPNSGNVTLSENGDTAKPLLTNSGNQIVPGGLLAGMMIAYLDNGTEFRLLTDQASAAIVALAEAAALEAAAYADFIRNNWVVSGPFVGTGTTADYLLSVDPGSANNMLVVVGGVTQLISQTAYSLVYSGGDAYCRISVPTDIPFEIRTGNAIDIGVPSDGSVTTAKIADDAVTYAKFQDVSATTRLLGRVSAGAGNIEELTANQIRDSFLPAGSVVDSTYAAYTTSADLTVAIPNDETIPQISEGTQILSVTITPKTTTNRLRIRFSGFGSNSTAGGPIIWAIFNGATDAIQAGVVNTDNAAATQRTHIVGEVQYTPGVTTTQTISVRVGPNTGGSTVRMNGAGGTRNLGGASACTLVVEEIKA